MNATPSVKHLDHLNLTVRDLAQSEAWYGRVFGFRRVDGGVWDGVRWAILRAGDALLCMYEYPEHTLEPNRARREAGRHGLNHFGLRITDPAAWEATVAREGLELLYGGPVRWPHSTAWYVADPTGYELEVACWSGDVVRFERETAAALAQR